MIRLTHPVFYLGEFVVGVLEARPEHVIHQDLEVLGGLPFAVCQRRNTFDAFAQQGDAVDRNTFDAFAQQGDAVDPPCAVGNGMR